jgi:hypothetical protein
VDFSLASLIDLTRLTVRDPRGAARSLIAWRLPMSLRWTLFGLIVVLSAISAHLTIGLMSTAERATVPTQMPGPFGLVVVQGAIMAMGAFLAFQLGRALGGKGNFADALLLVVWLQAILLGLQVLQLVVHAMTPILGEGFAALLGEVIGLVGLALTFWLLTAFVAELHQFPSMGRVFLGVVLTILAIGVFLSVLIVSILQAGMIARV